jgi:iron complex outermembrane receptor protein
LFTIPPGTGEVTVDCVGPQSSVHPVLPGLVSLYGSSQFDSEKLLAYETGYRLQIGENLGLDATTFYQSYSNLRTFETSPPFLSLDPSPHISVPLIVDNLAEGATYGLELTSTWEPSAHWSLHGIYSYLLLDIRLDETSTDPLTEPVPGRRAQSTYEGTAPRHQLVLRSSWDLPRALAVDATVRFMDELPAVDVDSYLVADLRLAWAPTANLEWSIVGQNLFDKHHLESAICRIFRARVTEVERNVYTALSWRF